MAWGRRRLITGCCCCWRRGSGSVARILCGGWWRFCMSGTIMTSGAGPSRVRGDVIEVFPTYDELAYRIELFGDEIESLAQIDPLFGTVKQKYARLPIYPKSHYVVMPEPKSQPLETIVDELGEWEAELEKQGRMVEAQRIHQRVRFDLEMIKSMGYCH